MKRKVLSIGFLMWFLLFLIISNGWALPLIGVEVAGGISRYSPDGDIAYKGDKLSLTDTLGFDSSNSYFGRAKIKLPFILPNIYLAYTPIEFEGENTLSKTITFANTSFTANTKIKSSLNMKRIDVGVYWGIPFLKAITKTVTLGIGGINVDFGIVGRKIDLEATVEDTSTNKKETGSATIYLPMLYGGIGIDVDIPVIPVIPRFTVELEGMGIPYSGKHCKHYYDITGRIKTYFFSTPVIGPSFFIGEGYKYEDFKGEYDDVEASFKISGPFGELGVAF